MLRNRDSFFQSQDVAFQSGMYPTFPYQQGQMSNMSGYNTNNYSFEDYDNRLAKIERQINRLDARLSKLESVSKIVNDDLSSSMYMV